MIETKLKFDIQQKSSHDDELYNYIFRLNTLLDAINLREKSMKSRIMRTDSSTNHNILKNLQKDEATKVAKSYAKHMLKYVALSQTTTNASQLIKESSSGNNERALDNMKENTSHSREECPNKFPDNTRVTDIDDKPKPELWNQPEIKPLSDTNHSSDLKPVEPQSLENYLQDKKNIHKLFKNDNKTPKHQTICIEQEKITQFNKHHVMETTKRDFIQIQENNSKSRCIHSCVYHEIQNKQKSLSILEQLEYVKKLFQNMKYLEKSMKNHFKTMEQFLLQTKSYLKYKLARKGEDSNWVWKHRTKLQSDLVKLNLYIKLLQAYLEKKNSISKSSKKEANENTLNLQKYWNYLENRYIQQSILEQEAQGDSLDREMSLPQCVMHIQMQYKREVSSEGKSFQPRKKMLKLESALEEQKRKGFLKYHDCSERIKCLAQPRRSYVIATKQNYKHVLPKDKIKFLNRMAGLDENCDLSPTPSGFIFSHRKLVTFPKKDQSKELIPKVTQSLDKIHSELHENHFKTYKSVSDTIMKKKTFSGKKSFSDYWLSSKQSRPSIRNRLKPKTIMCKTNDITTNTPVKKFFDIESMTETKKESFCVQTDSLILVDVFTQKPSETKQTKLEIEEKLHSIISKNKSDNECINKTDSGKSIATNCSSKSSKVRFSGENSCYYYPKEEKECQSIEKKGHVCTDKNTLKKIIDVNEELRGRIRKLKSNPHLHTSEEGYVVCNYCSNIQTDNLCTTTLTSWSSLLNQYRKNRRAKSFLVNEPMTKEVQNNIRFSLEENEESFFEYSSPESESRESVTSSNFIKPQVFGVDWSYAFIR